MADACTVDHLASCPNTCASVATNNACIKFPNRNNCKQGDLCKSFPANDTTCGVQYACQPTVVIGADFSFTVGSNDQGLPNRAIIGNIFGYTLPPSVTGTVTLTGITAGSTRRKTIIDPLFFSIAKPTSFVVDNLDVASLSLTSLPSSVTSVVYKNSGVTDISAVPLGSGVTSLSIEGSNSPIPTFPDPSSPQYTKLAGLTRLDLTNCQLSTIAWIFPPKLEHLVLTRNSLTRIPPTVFALNLTTLSLGDNPLGSTPISATEFEALKRVKQLILPSVPPPTCDAGSTLQAIQNSGSLCVSAAAASASSSTGLIVGLAIGGVVLVALVGFFLYRRKKQASMNGYNAHRSPSLPQRNRSLPRPSGRQSEMGQNASGPGRKSTGSRGSEPMARYTSTTGSTNQNNYPFGHFTNDKEMTGQSYFAGGGHTGTHTNRSTVSISDALNPAIPVLEADEMVYTRVLGRGAKGVVWLATYAGQACAVKKLTDLSSNADEALGNLIVESNLLFRIQHPRIIALLGVVREVTASGREEIALVMEFMDKGDLFECLQRTKATKDAPGLGWAGEKGTHALHVAEGLASLHTRSPPIIHRDIKARNVLVDSAKGAKICDFGESRTRTFEETMTSNVGTARWIAPEVLINEDYSEKADIYSFGVLLSELDTHAIPYSDSTLEERQIMQMVAVNRLRPTFSPNCPEQIQHLARHCMQADPSNRPDAARLVKTIMTILGSFVAL